MSSDSPSDEAPKPGGGTPVVAIGTSAGGLAACTALFEHMPVDTGCAFVIVQHLAPDHESHLAELLASTTSMPVVQISEGVALEPNHVYVIPPAAGLTIVESQLHLLPRDSSTVPMPVDGFLRALALERGPRAIAVILSGSGSDGSLGVQAIQEHGGVALAQDPAEAGFDGMPRSANATGCIDLVLPASQLGPEIARIAVGLPQSPTDDGTNQDTAAVASTADSGALIELVALLREATGVDFEKYRMTTVLRRLRRRIHLHGLAGIHAYREFVDSDPGELQELAKDILISVTHFFRDPSSIGYLQNEVFPALIRRTSDDDVVRIWTAGCSTGEEAYSLAIAFVETATRMRSEVTCQIFATDVNETLLVKARQGNYLANIASDVSKQRLERFFNPAVGGYRISRSIRELCVFSRHDVLQDPPLPHMDLVSCRNLLIYLGAAQTAVLRMMHFALEPNGYLMLGQAESVASCPDLFEVVDNGAHVFRARQKLQPGSSPKTSRDARRRSQSLIVPDEAASGAAYEELLATNEELQSLNEELESSKEEIESFNQELQTLNQELNSRNEALRIAHDLLDTTLDSLSSGLVVLAEDGSIASTNRSFMTMFQLPSVHPEHRRLEEVAPEYFAREDVKQFLQTALNGREDRASDEFVFQSTPRGVRVLLLHMRRIASTNTAVIAIDDVTDQRQAETDQRHSQKMEAIGHLAAGIAHDFNNLLTVVLAGAQTVSETLAGDSPEAEVMRDIIDAGERAADLTRQMLAYAGRGRQSAERVDLSELVAQSARLMNASLPTRVQLRLDLDRDLPPLLADRSQMHQVVDNLIRNAIEAIDTEAGVVTVRTGKQSVTRNERNGIEPGSILSPGDYSFVEVQDTGRGLSPEVQRQMFDPFFSTKFTGRGLGLAAVQGIVRQHHGSIEVHTVPGRGTSIRVLLSSAPSREPLQPRVHLDEPRRGHECVLIVDDEVSVTSTIRLALERFGYEVLVAGGGKDALDLLRENPRIGAVVLDAYMPGMNGSETLTAMRSLRPDLPALICSGAGNAAIESAFADQGIAGFLHKPFAVRDLGVMIANCFSGTS